MAAVGLAAAAAAATPLPAQQQEQQQQQMGLVAAQGEPPRGGFRLDATALMEASEYSGGLVGKGATPGMQGCI